MIDQLQDLINNQRFSEIIVAGIETTEKYLEAGEEAIAAGEFGAAEDLWVKAWSNLQWIALNVIQRRLRVGKNEGPEVRKRFKKLWLWMMTFGVKKKLAKKLAGVSA